MNQEKRIPTILGLILLLITIFASVILSDKNINPLTKASGDCQPINPQITNVTHNSASISFTTDGSCLANLDINNSTINDVRFVNTNVSPSSSRIHYFDVSGLEKNTEYNFELIVDGKNFNETEYKFKTASQPSSSAPSSNLAWGKVLNPDKTPVTEGIVYVNISGASPLSSFITSSGNWNLSLVNSFNESKTDWFNITDDLTEDIIVVASDQSQTQITNSASENNPVPDIILGQDNLSEDDNQNQETGVVPTSTAINQVDKNLTISNPSDNETISTQKPEFFGTAPSKTKITIKVESPVVFNGQTVVDENGNWAWSVPDDLTPGEHTITVTAENEETGIINTITRKFIVLAADNNPSFSASDSAKTITPTKVPTVLPTTPPSPTSTPKPTLIPTNEPTVVQQDDSSSDLPKTGAVTPTLLLLIMAVSSISFAFYYSKK